MRRIRGQEFAAGLALAQIILTGCGGGAPEIDISYLLSSDLSRGNCPPQHLSTVVTHREGSNTLWDLAWGLGARTDAEAYAIVKRMWGINPATNELMKIAQPYQPGTRVCVDTSNIEVSDSIEQDTSDIADL